MLVLQNISYLHPNKDLLFQGINLILNSGEKVALIGNNGVGKSTLLKIIAKELPISHGQLLVEGMPYYIPQVFGQFNHLTVAEALGVDGEIKALHAILAGSVVEEDYVVLGDDWLIEERCYEGLRLWELEGVLLSDSMGSLSGGQRTRVFLAGIFIHRPDFVLMDEPSNHLDSGGRALLYDFVLNSQCSLLLISHDRKLLNLLHKVCELSMDGIRVYGGNYDFYKEQKELQTNALLEDVLSKEGALRKAKEVERESVERQQKLDARAKKKSAKGGMPKIVANSWKNSAENSTSKMKGIHADKTSTLSEELRVLRSSLSPIDRVKLRFDNSELHRGKVLVEADGINFSYSDVLLWGSPLSFKFLSGERIALKGANGSGKTTLIKLLLGELEVHSGILNRAVIDSVYIDQDYSLIDNSLSVFEQALSFNRLFLLEHEVKMRLNRFLFSAADWNKCCVSLSGGERMRLLLCCLEIASQSPDLIILDEPTNNLDIHNIEILTSAISSYEGTLIVVSHDDYFLEQIGVDRIVLL